MLKKLITSILITALTLSLSGCFSEPIDQEVIDVPSATKIISLMETSKLQYPATNDLFYYNVYDDYVAITKYVGDDTFIKNESGLSNPKHVKIPDMIDGLPVYVVGESAFKGATIESLEISKNVVHIEVNAFESCENLKTVSFTDVTDTGDGVVNGEGVLTLGSGAFINCASLESITLPDSVTELGSSAFSGCESLKKINIPSQIIEIPSGFCSECSSLVDIYIADSVTSIGDSAFSNVSNEAKIHGGIYSASAQYAANHFMLFVIDAEKIVE